MADALAAKQRETVLGRWLLPVAGLLGIVVQNQRRSRADTMENAAK